MLLKNLLAKMPTAQIEVRGSLDREVTSIAFDSRRVQSGGAFVALRGEKLDGHHYLDPAVSAGCSVLLTEEAVDYGNKVTNLVFENTRPVLAELAAAFYDFPSRALKTAGITGTNGKTTVAFLTKHLLESASFPSGLIGTVRYEIGHRILPATRTTPESLELQELLSQMRNAGCKAVVMETSSHAIAQHRVRGVQFDAAVFTNLTQDHLDYHGTMQAYFDAKAELFLNLKDQTKAGKAIVNLDDRYGQELIRKLQREGVETVTYGLGARADFRATEIHNEFGGLSYTLEAGGRTFLVRLPLIGRFNIYNSLAALATAVSLGANLRGSVQALSKSPGVPGRLERVEAKKNFQVFVDYAHTPDALENVIRTLRELNPHRLIVVVGCGGNRDRAKRALMGEVCDRLADFTILTSDNPRKEDPRAILDEIKSGFRDKHFEIIEDRKEAIQQAVAMAEAKDIILVAGKGHETSQEFSDHTIPFDDVQVTKSALSTKSMDF